MADSGIAALDSIIERLKALAGPKTAQKVAERAAPLVDAEIKRTASAGTTPLGKTWKPKADGGKPLQNAAASIETTARGNIIATKLTGPTVFHHRGAQGMPVRQVIPDAHSVPEGVKKAVVKAAEEVLKEIAGGKG